MASGRLFDSDDGGSAANNRTPAERSDQNRTAPDAQIHHGVISIPPGFELTSISGWTVETVESIAREEAGVASCALALASRDQDNSEELGVFISFDVGQLLGKREWQMSLEQEMAKVRQRVRQFLSARRKSSAREVRPT